MQADVRALGARAPELASFQSILGVRCENLKRRRTDLVTATDRLARNDAALPEAALAKAGENEEDDVPRQEAASAGGRRCYHTLSVERQVPGGQP